MTGPADPHPLDDPVWSGLRGAHAGLAEVASIDGCSAGRYRRDVCPFGAVEDPTAPASWAALAAVLDGRATCLLLDPAAVPAGWEVVMVIPGVQMDGTGLEPAAAAEASTLTEADVPEMLALVERTRPGPFFQRTIAMGRYLGLRRSGELVAMAGERLHPSGWTEISGVCTDARHRGQGLGTMLVRAIAAGVRTRGELPFLHATADNVDAIRLYEAIGFTLRRTCSFTVVREQAGEAASSSDIACGN